jgi:hypothetical protein
MDKVFHPLGLTLSREEKSEDFEFIFKSLIIGIERCHYQPLSHVNLLADAADAITNGFKNAFSSQREFKRGMLNLITN